MTAQELNRLITEGHPPVIIDVRSKAEFKSGHIPGAVHIPMFKMVIRACFKGNNHGVRTAELFAKQCIGFSD